MCLCVCIGNLSKNFIQRKKKLFKKPKHTRFLSTLQYSIKSRFAFALFSIWSRSLYQSSMPIRQECLSSRVSLSHALMRGMHFGSQCPADTLRDAAGCKACYWPLLNARCRATAFYYYAVYVYPHLTKKTCIYYAKFRSKSRSPELNKSVNLKSGYQRM